MVFTSEAPAWPRYRASDRFLSLEAPTPTTKGGFAVDHMYGAAIAGHAITDVELDQAQRDALGAFKGFVETATVKQQGREPRK